ncbi:hypothetical protein SBA4_2940009 [Candidatus Sulfopaludibacter sp. SbA4]|nr:hypothetical protein SBA4_2940009 [Candidatus Sulfopaludibacter sp. SbA4]
MTLAEVRATKRDEIIRLATSRGARNIRVFGPVARGESGNRSDIELSGGPGARAQFAGPLAHRVSRYIAFRRFAAYSFVLGILAPLSFAQRTYNWVSHPPPVEVFAQVLDRIWASSFDDEPFRSVRGKFDPIEKNWFVTTVLPGASASQCRIVKIAYQTPYIFSKPHYEYRCKVSIRPAELQHVSATVIKLLLAPKPDWEIMPDWEDIPNERFLVGHHQVSMRPEGYPPEAGGPHEIPTATHVTVSYDDPVNARGGSFVYLRIVPEVLTVQVPRPDRFHFAPLPSPEVSYEERFGSALVVIANDTPHRQRTWLIGPTTEAYTISPGWSRTSVVVPGDYEVLSSDLGFYVSDPVMFLPFHGFQKVATGTTYTYHLSAKWPQTILRSVFLLRDRHI